ncbi:MAG: hypothetical protein QGI83_19280 [Candidatus Latescibacteria bacterium]|jgi:hypothetical protein|nr:hypothetical protein [Candidatus Latescibacterota bacterium]
MHEVDPAIQATIQECLPAHLPGSPTVVAVDPVRRPESNHPGVWVARTDDGTRVVVKHQIFAPLTRGEPHDLLRAEERVCRMLSDTGCPVARVYGVDPTHSLVFSEWCGKLTLDDVCQESDEASVRAWGKQVVEGFCGTQGVLRDRTPDLADVSFPECDRQGLLEIWSQTVLGIGSQVGELVSWLNPGTSSRTTARVEMLWNELVEALADAPSLLGPTDYNARNIVINTSTQEARFIEFAKLGWDWPERRLVQYTASMGSGRGDGGFRSALDQNQAAAYGSLADWSGGDPETAARRLDAHHVVFHVLAGLRLQRALLHPAEENNRQVLAAWRNPQRRARELSALLGQPLSSDSLVTELRTLLGGSGSGGPDATCA